MAGIEMRSIEAVEDVDPRVDPETPGTIAGVATPPGAGAIGIVKISGTKAIDIAARIFRFPSEPNAGENTVAATLRQQTHRLHHGYLRDPLQKRFIDEILLGVMLGPRSYTGEDVVEINAHCGPAVIARILDLILESGASLAAPGEFTRRAFLNGRIDLTQAEAVADMIAAESVQAVEIAAGQLRGATRARIRQLRDALLEMSAESEAAIDFGDEFEDAEMTGWGLERVRAKILDPLVQMLRNRRAEQPYRQAQRVAVIGKPNVGKSSLVNRLLQRERVIVSEMPGTTRDVVEESLSIRGMTIRLCDTAGVQDVTGTIDRIGIAKARQCVQESAGVLWVIEDGQTLQAEDIKAAGLIGDKPFLLVRNKADLCAEPPKARLPDGMRPWTAVRTSAHSGQGIEELKDNLFRYFESRYTGGVVETPGSVNARQIQALSETRRAVENLLQTMEGRAPAELVAIDLRAALFQLDRVDGHAAEEAVLDRVFRRFCIGK